MLTDTDKTFLLQLSRRTLKEYLETRQFKIEKDIPSSLKQKTGVFITLYDNTQQRGESGKMIPNQFLCELVQSLVVQAAVGDPLFPPLHQEELPRIRIEISVLSIFRKMKTIEDLDICHHGISITLLDHQGFLLPKVAIGNHWDKLTFLAQVCQKAGLSSHAWRDPRAQVGICIVDTFSE